MPNRRRIKYPLVPRPDCSFVAEPAVTVSVRRACGAAIASTVQSSGFVELDGCDPVPAVARPVVARPTCEAGFGFSQPHTFQYRMEAAYHCSPPHLPWENHL